MDDTRDVIGEAIATFGDNAQMVVACEELSELQKEICKALRGAPNYHHIAEEVADVEIMTMQLRRMFDIGRDADVQKQRKLIRLANRIDNYTREATGNGS